ncbi:MAG TPA: L,D-transpeptidase family protein [Steroidobacteraceae bacterium]|jgi:L,D-transpeptidase ErfK/SrfK|nr:L,D-transpeptidase family protein [Steroidobacteraceae bacterium]
MKKLIPLLLLAVTIPAARLAHAAVYDLPDPSVQVVGEDLHIKTHYSDTLVEIARQYGLGYEEIARANPKVDPWLPGEGTDIVIPGRHILPPGPRDGIIVNIPEHRIYYFPKPRKGHTPTVVTYPVSIGKMDWQTPMGLTHVVSKEVNPTWNPPASVRAEHLANGDPLPKGIIKSGPDNPLGLFAMRLAIHPGDYLIHGTNNPLAVGMAVTHGCIRMYPEDVAALFPTVPVGMKVYLINVPLKVAFVNGDLLLEAHPPVDAQGQTVAPVLSNFEALLNEVLGNSTTAVNWDIAIDTLKTANGIPVLVGLQADTDAPAPAATPAAPAAPAAPPATTTTTATTQVAPPATESSRWVTQ